MSDDVQQATFSTREIPAIPPAKRAMESWEDDEDPWDVGAAIRFLAILIAGGMGLVIILAAMAIIAHYLITGGF